MKCSDCPAFELLDPEGQAASRCKDPCCDYESKLQKKYGNLGACMLFNCPKRERDVMDCDTSIEESYLKLLKVKIKLAEKVIHHVRCRRKSK
jgi:hypothetical protein